LVATGNSWNAAPNAVAAKTPSVSRCSTASTRPGPITKFGISGAAQITPSQNAKWKNTAPAKKRNGIEAGSSRLLAPPRKFAAAGLAVRFMRPCSRRPGQGEAHLAGVARDDLVPPAAFVELGIKEHR